MNSIKKFKVMLQKLIYILNHKQRMRALYVCIIIIIGSLFELLGVAIILPFIQLILNQEELMDKLYIKRMIEFLHIQNSQGLIILLSLGIVVVYLIKNLFLTYSSYLQIKFRDSFRKDFAISMLKKYMGRPYTFFVNTNSSLIIRGVSFDVQGVYTVLEGIMVLMKELFATILIGLFVIYTDAIMAMGVLLLAGMTLISLVFGFKKILNQAGIEQQKASSDNGKALYQTINGIKEIKVMQKQSFFLSEFEKAAESLKKTSDKFGFIGCLPERIIETVCVAALIITVCIRVVMGADTVSLIPQLGTFAMAAFRILPSISRITGQVNTIIYFKPSLDEVYNNVLEAEAYEKEYNQYVQNQKNNLEEQAKDAFIKFDKELKISNITWSYDNAKEPVLEKLNLIVNKGESIALIGKSGAGKTTLSDIILGLLHPQEGSVEIDGVDVYTIPKVWAKIIGYVPQNIFLLDDTIRKNIGFGENVIDDSLVWQALKWAQLDKFVEGLPQKLDTVVGERGIKFSGGQRQRIAIARALYYNPDILVLDEATAALDNETENAVMEAIDLLRGQKTLIIIAHRLTTIRNCDYIYEIKNGQAVKCEKDLVLKNIVKEEK